ncbi:helix-turn-helix domain-containing protein [Vibrio fluvialis]|uniref:helix-turn-helix domain-containing protein n=1 Tax=Vibrio fluvialis TaxID=676 RepID=UPI00192B6054|nr:helix-turn-helix domain-containing protein [Vibrio fluvialis]MBL4297877.1 helix-turn-helix domain-containing protein [Vibrio fluvialis]
MTRTEKFGKRLRQLRAEKEAREQRKWTTDDVGKALGMTQSTYSNYENALRVPALDVIERIADFYKVSPAYIACFSDYKGNTDGDALLVLPALTENAKEAAANSLGDFGVSSELLATYGLERQDVLIDVVLDNSMAPTLIKNDVVILRRMADTPKNAIPHGLYCLKDPSGQTWFRWVKREINGVVQVYPESTTHYQKFEFTPEQFEEYTVLGSILKVIRAPSTDAL